MADLALRTRRARSVSLCRASCEALIQRSTSPDVRPFVIDDSNVIFKQACQPAREQSESAIMTLVYDEKRPLRNRRAKLSKNTIYQSNGDTKLGHWRRR
jgi:hypothetical protein